MIELIPAKYGIDPAPDFADREQAMRFPRHGWAYSSKGTKLMWRPIMRLVDDREKWRKERGLSRIKAEESFNSLAFYQTLRKLTLTLREIHGLIQTVKAVDTNKGKNDPDVPRILYRATDLLPTWIDLAYIYLRRLADRLAEACRFTLFEHYQSAPRTFKEMRKLVTHRGRIKKLEPIIDEALLKNILEAHSWWYDKLTQFLEEGKSIKGIRDRMEHHPVVLHVLYIKSEGSLKPVVLVAPFPDRNRPIEDFLSQEDLIEILRSIINNLCDLFTALCKCIFSNDGYIPSDYHFLVVNGDDDDVTGFWPEI